MKRLIEIFLEKLELNKEKCFLLSDTYYGKHFKSIPMNRSLIHSLYSDLDKICDLGEYQLNDIDIFGFTGYDYKNEKVYGLIISDKYQIYAVNDKLFYSTDEFDKEFEEILKEYKNE